MHIPVCLALDGLAIRKRHVVPASMAHYLHNNGQLFVDCKLPVLLLRDRSTSRLYPANKSNEKDGKSKKVGWERRNECAKVLRLFVFYR